MKFKFSNLLKYLRLPVDPVRRGISYSGGTVVTPETSMQVSAMYRGVIFISSQIAKIPWQIKDPKNNIIDNDISYLLNVQPNSEMSSMMFRLLAVQTAILKGNFFAEIERNTIGKPIGLWPIPTENIELYRIPNGGLVYRVIAGAFSGQDVYLPFNDVFHVKNFHTNDGLVGQGVVAYATEVLGISMGADRMANNLFANGGLPSGVLEVAGQLSDGAFERMKESWKSQHSGRKSGGVAILEEGAKFNPVTMSPDILQFLESRKFSVLEISRFLGLPPTKLFDTDATTFSNQENSNLEVITDTLDSWARMLEAEADIKILNKRYGGNRTELDLYAVSRGDMTTRSEYFSKMMQMAAISPNEIRVKEGMAPYSEGDRKYVAVNNYSPADRIDEIIDAQISRGQGGSPASDAANNADAKLKNAAISFLEGRRG
jgi:HK97 family phage portal protein